MTKPRSINIKKQVLGKDEQLTQDLHAEFTREGLLVANLINSPSARKTELLGATMAVYETHKLAAVTGMATDKPE